MLPNHAIHVGIQIFLKVSICEKAVSVMSYRFMVFKFSILDQVFVWKYAQQLPNSTGIYLYKYP